MSIELLTYLPAIFTMFTAFATFIVAYYTKKAYDNSRRPVLAISLWDVGYEHYLSATTQGQKLPLKILNISNNPAYKVNLKIFILYKGKRELALEYPTIPAIYPNKPFEYKIEPYIFHKLRFWELIKKGESYPLPLKDLEFSIQVIGDYESDTGNKFTLFNEFWIEWKKGHAEIEVKNPVVPSGKYSINEIPLLKKFSVNKKK